MNIRVVIWDLGGVLLRTEDINPREGLAKRLGMTRPELERLVFSGDSGTRAQLGKITIDQHWENVRHELELSPEAFTDFQDEFWRGDILDNKLVNYIRSLRSSYKTGLLSNAFSNLRQFISEIWKFSDAFDEMIISAEVGLMKPDPGIYQIALGRLNASPHEAVLIDDFPQNVEGARNVGMHAIHYQNPEQIQLELEHLLEIKN